MQNVIPGAASRQESSLWLFYLAYGLLVFGSAINSSELGFFSSNLLYLVVVCLAIARFLYVQVTHLGLLLVLVLLPVAGICVLSARAPEVFVAIALVAAAYGASFERIIRISLTLVLGVSVVVVAASLTGLIGDSVLTRVVNGKLVECHALGFLHYSKLPTFWFMSYLGYSYLNRSSYSLIKHVLWFVVGFAIYLLCYARLRFYLLIFAFIAFFLASRLSGKPIGRGIVRLSAVMFPAFLCVAMILAIAYNPSNVVFSEANDLLSGRLQLGQTALEQYGISALGQNVDMVMEISSISGDDYFFIDSAYIYIPVVYGILVTIAVFGAFSLVSYKIGLRGDRFALCWCLCIAIDCFVGNQLMSIWLCPLPFMLTSVITSESKGSVP